jgi:hypothetical protein
MRFLFDAVASCRARRALASSLLFVFGRQGSVSQGDHVQDTCILYYGLGDLASLRVDARQLYEIF